MNIISDIMAGIAIASLGFLAAVAKNKWSGRLRIIRIESIDQREWDGFVNVYEQCFPDAEDGPEYTVEDWEDYLGGDSDFVPPVKVENFLYVGMIKSEAFGFIVVHYYPDTAKAIISYIGAKPGMKSKEKHVTSCLVLQTLEELKKLDCEMVLFETEMDPRRPGKSKRLRLFRRMVTNPNTGRMFCRILGSKKSPDISTLNYNFPQPAVKIEKIGRHEKRMMELSIVFLDERSNNDGVDRDTACVIIHWLLMYCYGDVYSIHDDDCNAYRDYLSDYYSKLVLELPDNINYRN